MAGVAADSPPFSVLLYSSQLGGLVGGRPRQTAPAASCQSAPNYCCHIHARLQVLDGDEHRIRAPDGRLALRDAVQFVPFRPQQVSHCRS